MIRTVLRETTMLDKNYFLMHMDSHIREIKTDSFLMLLHLHDGSIHDVLNWSELTDGYVLLSIRTDDPDKTDVLAVSYESIAYIRVSKSTPDHRTTLGFPRVASAEC